MIVLGIPVLEQHELTLECVKSINDTVVNKNLVHLVIIDNGSDKPYAQSEFKGLEIGISIIHNKVNQGFYYPLLELYNRFKNSIEYIGLMHNDVYFYEKGWEQRVHRVFASDKDLMLLGLCGSPVVDYFGGRGMATAANFKGLRGAKNTIAVGELLPCALLDSLFMLFRTSFIPELDINEEITLCHFYDKIWSLKTIEKGKHVALLGIESDHMGGQTSCSPKYQEDAIRWCKEHNLELELQDGRANGDLTLYHEGERRYLSYFREQKKIIPMRIDRSYKMWRFDKKIKCT